MPNNIPISGAAASPDDGPIPDWQSANRPPIQPPGHAKKPNERPARVWTCFALLGVVIVAIIFCQVIGVVMIISFYVSQGDPAGEVAKEIPARLMEPGWLIFVGILGQAPILIGSIIAARLSPTESLTRRLKLRPLGWSPARYSLVALSIIPPTAIGMTGAWALTFLIPPDPTVEQIYNNMTLPAVVPFLLFISLVPGFCEEIFFRGYLQGRFLRRFGPGAAILLTSFIFGIFHVMPHAVLFATVVGFWLGYVAWKTDSIWPTIVCHAFINGIWNVFQIGSRMLDVSEGVQFLVLGVAVFIGMVAFVATWRMLNRIENPSHA